MRHTPSLKLAPLCLALTSCTGLCAPTGTYELFPEDMGTDTPDLRMQDMRGGKDAKMERDIKEMGVIDLGKPDQGGKDLDDMCIPTTTSDDEDWLCDGIDNDCDGKKDENCCPSYVINTIFELEHLITNLKIESKIQPINTQQNQSEQWIITTQHGADASNPSLTTIYQIDNQPIQSKPRQLESCPYATITPAKKPTPETANNRYTYHCDGNAPKGLSIEFTPSPLYDETAYETNEIITSPAIEGERIIAISSPTQDPKFLWTTIITAVGDGSFNIKSCKLNISKTLSDIQANPVNCTELKTKDMQDFNPIHYLHQTPLSENKPIIHYTWFYQENRAKSTYTSEASSIIPPYLNIELHTHPTVLINDRANQTRIHIASPSLPDQVDKTKNTINLYTVNFGQEITQAPIELLPRNHLNQWPAMTEIDRDGVKGAEQVALVWQQDKRLMLAIFDPYNPGTISPKAITPEYPTATNIISSIASDDKGLGIAWTVEGEDPQQIYYQAVSFKGDFICPASN